jgi:RraA family protein
MSEGIRIKARWDRVAPGLVDEARALPVANISDCMARLTGTGALLRFHRDATMAGPAFTVRVRPGDNLLVHKALDMAQPGDVVVVDAGGDVTNALIGELMVTHARVRGIAGIVIDGAIRDRDELLQINFPVFARAVSHRGPYKDGPGEIGFAISLDGMVVEPGDLIVGDGDGVLAVPRSGVAGVLERARAKQQAEAAQMRRTLDRELDRSWIDKELEAKGCVYLD